MTTQESTDHAVAVRRGVTMPMRDGVALVADIYGPDNAPRPVILERTPYGRRVCDQSERVFGAAEPPSRAMLAARYVGAGFVYVVQDCRGTGSSEGVFAKYVQEPADGADSIAWLLAQTWCDGRVCLVGHSYLAACQISLADVSEKKPAAMVPDCGGFSNAFRSGVRQGGAFDQKQATWAYREAVRELVAAGRQADADDIESESVETWLKRGPWVEGSTPLALAPDHQRNLSAFWRHGVDGPFWRRPGLYVDPGRRSMEGIPTLFITSWHDTSLVSALDNFSARQADGDSAAALVIGPWCHAEKWTPIAGEVDFGEAALPEQGLGGTMLDIRLSFIAEALAGKPPSFPRVRYFEMGGGAGRRADDGSIEHSGVWRATDQWPPQNSEPWALWLAPEGLAESPPGRDWSRSFVSDPDNPVPTLGGGINSGKPLMPGGMYDQSRVFPLIESASETRTARDDIFVLLSAPLTEDLHLCGEVEVDLRVSIDAPDADITIKLMDCYPDGGPALNLSDGILRLRYRNSFIDPQPMPENERDRVVVKATPVAAVIRAGHRIRLDIAASNFPHFDVNPQTGAPEGERSPRRQATITIHSGHQDPSALRLRRARTAA